MPTQPSISKRPQKPNSHSRSVSASEIARNLANFETWTTYQNCEQVSYSDVPDQLKADVATIFCTDQKLPLSWVEKPFRCTLDFSKFLRNAHAASPQLFSSQAKDQENNQLFEEIAVVFLAWKRLRQMRDRKEKWSEADYVANVYNVFRSPAIRDSTYRVQCTISLPQPCDTLEHGIDVPRVLNTKSAVPDCAIFLPASVTRSLSHSAKSPYKVLKSHPAIVSAGNSARGSSFRYQSTPCAQLPDMPGFEFISSFWEDKKPVHSLLDDAFRQNRMSTAAAVRHLHSLHVEVPVIGLIWANGTVRAHVDWCEEVEGKPNVLSAPYPTSPNDSRDDIFHEWVLDEPSDILRVYFLVRNIDQWTMGGFRQKVVAGVTRMVEVISNGEGNYRPWKRVGDLPPPLSIKKENVNISITTVTSTSSPSPPRKKTKRKKRRSSH
ncbi:hypothetical protein BJ138DRAFT_1111829 [Hygrophoropsis aurantiaca]|uniref:Uncharacterized protein n=1 Tax=Hygrophoropsis aurantiaca TaxID=72124 RepID=A0ACB8AIH4_9AGAM|nr:hypothetical protein BJ138DRAFT_1111829 [Hygrophoropsis aurantiaca]